MIPALFALAEMRKAPVVGEPGGSRIVGTKTFDGEPGELEGVAAALPVFCFFAGGKAPVVGDEGGPCKGMNNPDGEPGGASCTSCFHAAGSRPAFLASADGL